MKVIVRSSLEGVVAEEVDEEDFENVSNVPKRVFVLIRNSYGWGITHVPTGLEVYQFFSNKEKAKKVCRTWWRRMSKKQRKKWKEFTLIQAIHIAVKQLDLNKECLEKLNESM